MLLERIRSAIFKDHEAEMSFFEHLGELRNRLLYSMLAIVVFAIIGFTYAREIIIFLMGPLEQATTGLDIKPELHFTSITEPLFQSFKIALFAGIFLAFPFWVWQVWKFIAPGLYDDEKKHALPFILTSTALFLIGVTFAYKIAVPTAYRVLLIYARPQRPPAKIEKKTSPGLTFEILPFQPSLPRKKPDKREPIRSKKEFAKQKTLAKKLPLHQPPSDKKDLYLALKLKPHPKVTGGWKIQLQASAFRSLLTKDGKIQSSAVQKLLKKYDGIDFRFALGKDQKYRLRYNWKDLLTNQSENLGDLKPILTLQAYLSVSSWFLMGFGFVFQTPMIIFLLVLFGIVTPQFLEKYRRHAFVIILAVSAVLTPTGDPLNLMIMAIPMYILFELGLFLSKVFLDKEDDDDDDPPPNSGSGSKTPKKPSDPDNDESPASQSWKEIHGSIDFNKNAGLEPHPYLDDDEPPIPEMGSDESIHSDKTDASEQPKDSESNSEISKEKKAKSALAASLQPEEPARLPKIRPPEEEVVSRASSSSHAENIEDSTHSEPEENEESDNFEDHEWVGDDELDLSEEKQEPEGKKDSEDKEESLKEKQESEGKEASEDKKEAEGKEASEDKKGSESKQESKDKQESEDKKDQKQLKGDAQSKDPE